jgi:hypothetical protein
MQQVYNFKYGMFNNQKLNEINNWCSTDDFIQMILLTNHSLYIV